MIFNWMLHKIKSFFLVFVNLFQRALCCFRKRRHSYSDSVQLTHVISNTDEQREAQTWPEWTDESLKENQPKTIQDYIEKYREQTVKARAVNVEENPEDRLDFFEDMAPQITRQTKILVNTKNDINGPKRGVNYRLGAIDDEVSVIPSRELGEWDENSGWEGEQLLDQEAQKILREQKRLAREKRRLEKNSRPLGSKLAA